MDTAIMKTTLPEALSNVGSSLIVGAVGASVFYFLKGVRYSRKGQRLAGGAEAVRWNAARIRHWAAWSGLAEAIGCAMINGRQKDDAFNFIVLWGGANALLSMSEGRGARAAVTSGLKGAALGGVVGLALCGFTDALEKVEN